MNKEEISKETKSILQNCWVMTTNSNLDEQNLKLKEAITEILNKIMTPTEKSEYWYKYYIEHKQYNNDLEYNKKLLKDWSNILKGMGNRNYPYCYAIDRILTELERSDT